MTLQDFELLQRRRDLIGGELRKIQRACYALFTGRPIGDRRLIARINAGDVLAFTPDDLLA